MAVDVATWDAHAEADIGVLIRSYLLTHPAPDGSDLAPRLDGIARGLLEAGRLNLQSVHTRRLHAVIGGA